MNSDPTREIGAPKAQTTWEAWTGTHRYWALNSCLSVGLSYVLNRIPKFSTVTPKELNVPCTRWGKCLANEIFQIQSQPKLTPHVVRMNWKNLPTLGLALWLCLGNP